MNKKLLTIASIFALSSLTVLAEEAADTTVVAPAPAATLFEEFASVEELSNVSLSLGLGYESQYVFRGVQLAGGIVTPGADLGYALTENAGIYLGYWGAYSVNADNCEENDIYLGFTYDYEFASVDLGYTAYTYTNYSDTNEIKAVFTFDSSSIFADGINLNPYIGFFYDFDFEDQFVTEIGISYSIPVSQYITGGDWGTLDLAYYMGYASYCANAMVDGDALSDYFYTGFSVDANIAINEICSFSIGLRYAYNDSDNYKGQNSNIWFGTGFCVGF